MKMFDKHLLNLDRLVSFCADNAPTNFGGAEYRGENNVFARLIVRRQNLIGVGCPAHVLHNAAKHAADNLPWDVEAIVFKLASHFKSSTKRFEALKEFCEQVEVH